MAEARRLRVAHVVPSMDIGGVEMGIARSLPALGVELDYRVYFVRRAGKLACGQRPVRELAAALLRGDERPDVVVTSLWWAHPVGYVCQRAGIPWLAFFHSAGFAHRPDELTLRWAWAHADARIVDSEATRAVMARAHTAPAHVVPYVFPSEAGAPKPWAERAIDVAWIGRNDPVKRLDLVLAFLRTLAQSQPDARFAIVIAGGVPAELAAFAQHASGRLRIITDADPAQVRRVLCDARFHVLFSDREGMSMSTVEAVQAGCVAVSRPVGEIPSYLDASCAVLVDDVSERGLEALAQQLSASLGDAARAESMAQRARERVEGLPTYVRSLAQVLRRAAEAP